MATSRPFVLPPDFLSTPAANIVVTRIDFANTTVPDYRDLYALILDNVLTQDECDQLLRGAEGSTTPAANWERAMINVGNGRQELDTETRSCGRIIWDSPDVASLVWKRIEAVKEVQEIVRLEDRPRVTGFGPQKRREVWRFSRPNERMRFLKYQGGEYFRPHFAGMYETPDRRERSYFTLHLYLNDAAAGSMAELKAMTATERLKAKESGKLIGGATTFNSFDLSGNKLDVLPKIGRVLLFQQRGLFHSGDDVIRGVKYTMRTDLMYALESSGREENGAEAKAKNGG